MRLVKSPASPTINQLGFRDVGKSGVALSRRVSGCSNRAGLLDGHNPDVDETSLQHSTVKFTAKPKNDPNNKMSVVCRACFIAAPKEPVPGYTLKQRSRTLIFAAFTALNYPGILLVWTPSGHISMFIQRAVNRGIKHGTSQTA